MPKSEKNAESSTPEPAPAAPGANRAVSYPADLTMSDGGCGKRSQHLALKMADPAYRLPCTLCRRPCDARPSESSVLAS
jgi:hypothetical protein